MYNSTAQRSEKISYFQRCDDPIFGCYSPAQFTFEQGETDMGDKGGKDKGGKEQKKKPKLNLKEKRKAKKEKENNK